MARYIAQRLLAVIPIFLFATLLSFGMIRLSPVDPAEVYLTVAHIHPTEEVLAEVRKEFGLDQPLLVQYAGSILKMCRLDFGISYITKTPVWDEVKLRMPATLQLAFSSILVAIIVSVPLGFFSAIYKNGIIDQLSRGIAFLGASIPQFWMGYLLIFFFALKLDLLPVQGRGSWENLVLPSVTLAMGLIAIYTRLLRANVLEQLHEPYVIFARTRGLRERLIMSKHVLRIAISPMITGLGMNIGRLLAGTIIVEEVFSWPGFGRYFVESIFNRDLPVIQCYVFLVACIFIVSNLLVDLLQMLLDPRITRGGNAKS
ncbi:nickel ABC transporter permease subunit NikB [Paenibacillus sp. GD4]|jgi:nickel transport system permease protein|uniref:nickel ABC transporter permease subunit NikB n=1 Tax=Paenibacillus sp. GD4 TaxID=3068890 RepID=UPI002796B8DB|nr:nickel ABC transporter permease subunit NikB [Paenibacillus sp. GD4]MDQ1913975.1 nickel ABC transporter permease subunit NikB [Paenibacillus sp. GD4]